MTGYQHSANPSPLTGIVAIFRGLGPEAVTRSVERLVDPEFVTAVEITADSPDAFTTLSHTRNRFADRFQYGMGTVRTVSEVAAAAAAGAGFVLAPGCNPAIIAATKKAGLLSIPGVMTPTEIDTALMAGADILKIFPANALGVDYLTTVIRPFGNVNVLLSGSLTPQLIQPFVGAGFDLFGIGGQFLGLTDGIPDWSAVSRQLDRYRKALSGLPDPGEEVT